MDYDSAKLETFLSRYLPQCIGDVERLSGGFTNLTYRLHLKNEFPSGVLDNSNNCDLLIIIDQWKLKSFIAKVLCPQPFFDGNMASVSVTRQKIEENFLKLFQKCPHLYNEINGITIDLQSVLSRNKTIRIGRVWLRDELDNILLLEDVGSLLTLHQWFTSEKRSPMAEMTIATVHTYGQYLGKFLVDFQITSLANTNHLNRLFHNPNLIQGQVTFLNNALENLRNTQILVDTDQISSIYLHYFEQISCRAATDSKVLTHGDFNPRNILIDEENELLVPIDWEIAGIRSPAFDLASFIGRCAVYKNNDVAFQLMLSFSDGLMDAYQSSAKQNDVSWYKNKREQYMFAYDLGTLYGIALIFLADIEECCPTLDDICSHRRNMALEGADYIKRCQYGPEKHTYDIISQDSFLGRLF